ncbi:MAG: hypothetical protein KBG46_08285 [Paracoccus sp.]|nr:hypothetical protein [Paracoccus sp. (in: a-proteobacteria)]
MAAVTPIDNRIMLERAARALGVVDHWGPRGLTMLSLDAIEAMALTLATLGLVAVPPGAAMPETLILKPEEA